MAIVERDSLTTHVDGAGKTVQSRLPRTSTINSQFQTSHLFRVQVRGKPNDFLASTLDQRRISSVRIWQKPSLTGQHRMRLTPDPDRGTNTKITFAIVGP